MTRVDDITRTIIGAAFSVHNAMGCGFLEAVYENALVHELRKSGLHVGQQVPFKIHYDGTPVGTYTADVLLSRLFSWRTKPSATSTPPIGRRH